MNLRSTRNRVLDPLERFSEIVFGLIMVLTFTCTLSVTQAGRDDIRVMLFAAIGCNLAWGLIDGAFYLIACLTEQGHNAGLLRTVQQARDPAQARAAIVEALPPKVAEILHDADFERISAHLAQLPAPAERPRFTAENWRGAVGVFLLVFLSTFPVVVPFLVFQKIDFALRISNLVAIALLFGAGYALAGYAGLRRLPTGLAMVAVGALMVGIAILLGG